MLTVSPSLLASINNNYRGEFVAGLAKAQPFYSQLAMTVNSTTSVETYINIGDFPRLEEFVGARQLKKLKAVDWSIKNKTWEGTMEVPRAAVEDAQFGFYNQTAQQLGDSAARLPDELVAALLEAGFTANGYDATTFFSTAHLSNDGASQSNRGTTALAAASYEVARAALRNLTSADGVKLDIIPDLLIVPPALEGTAKRIVEAETVAAASGTSQETNVNRGTARVLVINRLTDATNWYLMDSSKTLKPFIYQNRQSPELVSRVNLTDENVFMYDQFQWGVRTRGNAGYALWQLIFGAIVAG